MFIHIGSNITVSDRECVGIFNIETLRLSDENIFFLKDISPDEKTVALTINNKIIASPVSPFTVIKRDPIGEEEIIWSRNNE